MRVIFFRWNVKPPCIKNSKYESQAKKNDSDCNFYNFSLLVPYPNKFLVVCICILIFRWFILPLPTNTFLWGAKFCHVFLNSCLVARGWEDFEFLGDLLYWENLISFLGEGGHAIFFHKAINDQSCKLKNSWRQNYLLRVSRLTFLTFTWEFFLREFSVCSSVHWNSKKCLPLFVNNSVKVFDMSSK